MNEYEHKNEHEHKLERESEHEHKHEHESEHEHKHEHESEHEHKHERESEREHESEHEHEREQQWISKKELLQLTGISYGQLYRWKRQNLIPESWFVKQSSFTGQETFFPRVKILERVDAIMTMKDGYSLDDLARLFNPSMTEKKYTLSEIKRVGDCHPLVLELLENCKTAEFSFQNLLFIEWFSTLLKSNTISPRALEGLLQSALHWNEIDDLSRTEIWICALGAECILLLLPENGTIRLDMRLLKVCSIHADALVKTVSQKMILVE